MLFYFLSFCFDFYNCEEKNKDGKYWMKVNMYIIKNENEILYLIWKFIFVVVIFVYYLKKGRRKKKIVCVF